VKHLLRLSGFACCLFLTLPASLFAQDAAPSMSVILSSSDRLKDDIKFMLDLTTPAEQKQWKTVKEYLDDVFLLGLDGKRLHRYDLISGPDGIEYRSSFPIKVEKDFIDNLELFGIKVRRRGRNLYYLSDAYEGIMRIIDDYGVIGQRKDVPIRGFEPIDNVIKKYVLKPDGKTPIYDLMFLLLNQNGKPAARQKSYADVKKELMAAVKQAEDETKEDFELRHALTELQIDELGRYYTDPKELVIGWTLDETKEKKGFGSIDLLPDAETPLAEAVAQLGQVPSRYEAIPEPEGKILSSRINWPLDKLQIGNLVRVTELLAERGKSKVAASETLKTDEQKAAMNQVISVLSASAIETINSGRFDGFVHCRPSNDGKYTFIGGAQFKNAQNITAAIKQLQIARPERKIALDVAEHEGLTIHEIQISPDHEAQFDDLCGSNKLHIAVGENEFWYSIGADSLDAIKAAVTTADEKTDVKPNDEFFSFLLKPGPLVEWRDRHAKPAEPEEIQTVSDEEEEEGEKKKIKVDREQLRRQAIEAFKPGDDVWTMSLKRQEDRVKGAMTVDTGILRLVGKLIAQFSEETLEE
jgi:hypothetical protein